MTNDNNALQLPADNSGFLPLLQALDFKNNYMASVSAATNALLSLPQAPAPVTHHFYDGIYIREVSIAAGTFAVGYYQKTRHLNIMLKGRVIAIDKDGNNVEWVAPMIFMAEPSRKIGYVVEDMVWLNVYQTTETDIETLENMLMDKSEYAVNAVVPKESDGDYEAFLSEIGMTDAAYFAESCGGDVVGFEGASVVKVADSAIHGKGLFATADIEIGGLIPAIIGGKKTPAARFANHAKESNVLPVEIGGDIYFMADKKIGGCRGGLNGDEITVDYRHVRLLCQE